MSDRIRHVAILAHPDTDSFNAAVVHAYADVVREAGQDIIIRDLYAMGFDPILKNSERPGRPGFELSADVRDELALIQNADVYVVVHPIWFGMPPAMLTGYVDRVIGAGVTARDVEHRQGQSVLNGKHLLHVTTAGASDVWLDEQGQIESLRTLMGRYLFKAFAMKRAEYLHFGGIVEGFDPHFVDQNLRDVRDRAKRICALLADEHWQPAHRDAV